VEEVRKLSASLEQKYSGLEDRLKQSVAGGVDAPPPHDVTLGDSVQRLWDKCAELDAKIATTTARQATTTVGQAAAGNACSALERQVRELDHKYAELNSKWVRTVDSLPRRSCPLENDLRALEASVQAKFTDLNNKLAVTVKTAKLQSVADDVKKLRESLDVCMEELSSKLDAEVCGLQDSLEEVLEMAGCICVWTGNNPPL